jgi:hypothetical protein
METETVTIISDTNYPDLCNKLSKQVVELENQVHSLIERNAFLDGINSRNRANVNFFEDRLKDAVLNEEIDKDLAAEFADLFSFSLMQEVDLEVTVTFRGTAKLPLNEVAEDFDWESELSVSCDSHWSEIDFMVEDVSDINVEIV